MAIQLCPTCGQELKAGQTTHALHEKLNQENAAAVEAARKASEKEFALERKQIQADADAKAKREAAKLVDQQVKAGIATERRALQRENAAALAKKDEENSALKQQVKEANKNKVNEIAKAVEQAKVVAAAEATAAERKNHSVREERIQKEADKFKLLAEKLERQLQSKTSEQRGEEGERDLYAELIREWPMDTITRVGRGERAADITQIVRDANRQVAGKIIFERKETQQFTDAFIEQARRYRTEQKADLAVIVSRTLPSKKQQQRCSANSILVLQPGLVIPVLAALRESILDVAKHRLAKTDANPKAEQLYSYIMGNDFKNQFRDIDAQIEKLIEIQKKERRWHEEHWKYESGLHELLEDRHMRISVSLTAILNGGSSTNGSGSANGSERKAPGRDAAYPVGLLAKNR